MEPPSYIWSLANQNFITSLMKDPILHTNKELNMAHNSQGISPWRIVPSRKIAHQTANTHKIYSMSRYVLGTQQLSFYRESSL